MKGFFPPLAPAFFRRAILAAFGFSALTSSCTCDKPGGSSQFTNASGNLSTLSTLDFGNVAVGQLKRQSLPLRNTGSNGLDILTQAVASDSTSSFSEPTLFASSIGAGSSSTAVLEFLPTQSGPLTAVLKLTSDGVPDSATVQLTGTGIDIEVTAAPAAVDFGSVQVGIAPPASQSVTFTNNGGSPALLTVDPTGVEPEYTLTDSSGNGISKNNTQTLAAGASYVVQVAFEPDSVSNFSSSFAFTACDIQNTCLNPQSVSLNGVGVTAQLAITPDPIGFSNVAPGSSVTQTVTVQNVGGNSAQVACVYLASTGNSTCDVGDSTFAFSGFSQGAPSGTSPVVLAPNQSFTFTLTYTASGSSGGDNDTLDVDFVPLSTSTVSTATDPIIGDGNLAPCTLTVTPATLNFGTVTVNTLIAKAATLTNTGGQICNVTGIALDPSSDASYTLPSSQATSLNINAGASATLTVDFDLAASATPNTRKGTVDFASNDPNLNNGTLPLVATLNATNPYANGWPKWHYDNNNSGQTTADTSANSGKVVWKFTGLTSAVSLNQGFNAIASRCGGEAYLNSPVVSDNPADGGYYVYQMSLDGTLYAFDQGGNQVWSETTSSPEYDPHPSTPAVAKNGNLWVISGSDETSTNPNSNGSGNNSVKDLFYLSPSGSTLYSEVYGEDGFDACPGLGPDGTLFEADDDGEVGSTTSSTDPYSAIAFTAQANNVTIEAGLPFPLTVESERFGIAIGNDNSSYWGNNGQFFAVTPDSSGFQLNSAWPAKGVTVTSNANDSNCAGPVYSDLAIDPVNTNFVYAYSAWEDGTLCFNFGTGCSATVAGGCSPPYTVQGLLVALSITDGSVKWQLPLPATQLPSGWTQLCSDYGNGAPAVATNGTVYVGNSDGLRAVTGATGAVQWLFPSANVTSAPAIGGDGTVFFGTGDDSFYALNPNGTLKFKVTATGVISSSPAIADDGTVFFVSDDGVLWAVR